VQDVVDDRDLVPDEVEGADHRHDPKHERISQVIERRRQRDELRVPLEESDREHREVRVQPCRRRQAERRAVGGEGIHPATLAARPVSS
jgi:hypothetical protein